MRNFRAKAPVHSSGRSPNVLTDESAPLRVRSKNGGSSPVFGCGLLVAELHPININHSISIPLAVPEDFEFSSSLFFRTQLWSGFGSVCRCLGGRVQSACGFHVYPGQGQTPPSAPARRTASPPLKHQRDRSSPARGNATCNWSRSKRRSRFRRNSPCRRSPTSADREPYLGRFPRLLPARHTRGAPDGLTRSA